MIQNHLNTLTRYLQSFLATYLPKINENYWEGIVLPSLSFSQKNEVNRRKTNSIFNLDNASLFRIFERNLHEISAVAELQNNSRSIFLRMVDLRNKYSHYDGSEIDLQTQFIELSTIEEFYKLIKVPDDVIAKITNEKNAMFNSKVKQSKQIENISESKFTKGDMVYVVSDNSKIGSVTNVTIGDTATKYKVLINGAIKEFYESQLEFFVEESSVDFIDLSLFNAKLSSQQILNPNTKSILGSNTGNVDFIPYQYRPVMKVIQSDRPRILIADEVGIGKTIEAILIMRELQARQDLNNVLIICPLALVTERKWYRELKRFNEEFEQVNRQGFKAIIEEYNKEGAIPKNRSKIIVPYSVFDSEIVDGDAKKNSKKKKTNNYLLNLDPPPKFDLVIVDEAHKIRNKNTYDHKAVEFFCNSAEAVIFLSATPIQLNDTNLFTLLNVLRPDYFIDYNTFKMISEPNKYINESLKVIGQNGDDWQAKVKEKLNAARNTQWGRQIFSSHPAIDRVLGILGENSISDVQKVELHYEIEQLHTLSNFINRTRRRHIGNFTSRNSKTVKVSLTEDQKMLYDKIIELKQDIYTVLHDAKNTGFMMSTLLRQLSSSIFGLIPFIEDILKKGFEDIDLDLYLDENLMNGLNSFKPIRERIDEIIDMINNFDEYDEKYENLKKIVLEKGKMENKKIMIFSSFRHTISYLMKRFEGDGIKCETIHGDVEYYDRFTIKERFELNSDIEDGFDVLISSEVGSEGLDFQFCDTIVNYDIPWNPMRIEQRIGRIDRYGQKSDVIVIYNFITEDTIDYTIYDRCLLRIGIFENSIGASEEILGDIFTEILQIAMDFKLTEKQRKEKLDQITENKIRELKELEKLEQESENLIGIDYNQSRMLSDLKNAQNHWLSTQQLENLVVKFFDDFLGKNVISGEKAVKNLRIGIDDRQRLLVNYRSLALPANQTNKEWENWLRGTDTNLPITFEPNQKSDGKPAKFINILHPLVKQAAHFFNTSNQLYISLLYSSNEIPEGTYPFALYLWIKKGWKNELIYQPVCPNEFIKDNFIDIIKDATNGGLNDASLIDSQKLDAIHYKLWDEAKRKFSDYNSRLIDSKMETLKYSFYNRIANIKQILETNPDERIKIMKKSELEKLKAEEKSRIEEYENKKKEIDILAETVAYGLIEVKRIGGGL